MRADAIIQEDTMMIEFFSTSIAFITMIAIDMNFNFTVIASVSIVLSDKQIKYVGDVGELEKACVNVQELDLSKNQLSDWTEVWLLP